MSSPSRRPPPHTRRPSPTKTPRHPKTTDWQHQPSKPSQPRHTTPPRLMPHTPRRPPDRQALRMVSPPRHPPGTSRRLRMVTQLRLHLDISRLLRPATQDIRPARHLRPDIRNNLRRAIQRHPPATKPLHRVTQATLASRLATNHRHRGATQRQRRDTPFNKLRRPCLKSRRRSSPRPLAG